MDIPKEKVILVMGHYGVGKTNFTLNLAKKLIEAGEELTLVDLDIVNPYFRSGDYAKTLGCPVILPNFHGTTLDTPSLSAAVDSAIMSKGRVLIDVGGDDAGSAALGRYSEKIKNVGYAGLYVLNFYRPLTRTPTEALEILKEIEKSARLTATGVINNSNLGRETRAEDIAATFSKAEEFCIMAGLPLMGTAVPKGGVLGAPKPIAVDINVKFPWEE